MIIPCVLNIIYFYIYIQAENLTPTKKDHVESGYVCGTPVIQSCAQSANSENRSWQNLFQQSLVRCLYSFWILQLTHIIRINSSYFQSKVIYFRKIEPVIITVLCFTNLSNLVHMLLYLA